MWGSPLLLCQGLVKQDHQSVLKAFAEASAPELMTSGPFIAYNQSLSLGFASHRVL